MAKPRDGAQSCHSAPRICYLGKVNLAHQSPKPRAPATGYGRRSLQSIAGSACLIAWSPVRLRPGMSCTGCPQLIAKNSYGCNQLQNGLPASRPTMPPVLECLPKRHLSNRSSAFVDSVGAHAIRQVEVTGTYLSLEMIV